MNDAAGGLTQYGGSLLFKTAAHNWHVLSLKMSQNFKSNLSHSVPAPFVSENTLESDLITLPDLPLLSIIQNVAIQSLITDLSIVHPRFVPFCDIVLQQNHRLILYIGDLESIQKFKCSFRIGIPFENYLVDANGKHRSYEPEFYRLHYDTLNDETVAKLVTSMPAISHLEVVISQVNIYLISRLIRLLTHWASTLKWLKVCCGEFQPEDFRHFFTLIREMNFKLSVLEHLTLDLDGELLGNYQFGGRDHLSLDWPILGQLKEFFLQTRDRWYVKTILDALERQAGDQLTSIGLGFPFAWDYFKKFVNHPLAARFTLLSSQNEPRYERPLFPNLTGYSTHWHLNEPLNSLTTRLSTLQHLQYLELRRLPPNGNVSVDAVRFSPMPSVEILRIHFNNLYFSEIQDHTVLQDAHWAPLFPSVQIINLIHLGDFCAKCYPEEEGNYRNNSFGFEHVSERMSCLSQLLSPLTVLPSLRKIFYQRNHDLKNIAEFTGNGEFVKTHAYIY